MWDIGGLALGGNQTTGIAWVRREQPRRTSLFLGPADDVVAVERVWQTVLFRMNIA